jgi:type IV pilus assembly protein PilW
MIRARTPVLHARRRQAGLSLIELMVAITIGLFLLVGLVSVFATSNQTYVELGKASQQIENGRFAMQILTDDIGHAGFYGRYSQSPTLPGALPDPCVNNNMTQLRDALALPIQGYDSPANSPITACLPAANHVGGTDILVLRRADSTMSAGDQNNIPNAALTANAIYIQSNADSTAQPIIAVGTGIQATDQAAFILKNKDPTIYSPIRRYHVHIYFVAPCSVPAGGGSVCTGGADDNGAPIPTLKRLELTANGTMTVISLVEGIETLQFDYGIDTDKDGVPDGAYTTAPATVADWSNVVAVRINVLSRQIEMAGGGYVDAKSYDLGLAGMMTPGGPYKRHVYNSVIRIVNPAARRES